MNHKSFLIFSFSFFVVNIVSAQELVSLEQVIGLAMEKNYDVRVSKENLRAAKNDKNLSTLVFAPQVSANASTVWTSSDQRLEFQDATRNNKGKAEANNTTATVQLNWTLFDGSKMFATRERIATLASQGELLVKDQMTNTVANVIANYYDIVRQKQQLKAVQEQMSVSEERVKLAEKKLEVGTGIKPELLQARVDYNAQRTQVMQQESTIIQLKEQLNALVGLQLPSNYDVADSILINLELQPNEQFQNIENKNFGLLAARENLSISTLSLREARASFLPVLSFNAAYNYSRNDNTKLINPFGSIFSQSQGYNYGFTVSLPLFPNLNTLSIRQRAKVEVNRQQLLYEQQRNNVNIALRNAFVNYENAKRILTVEEETIGLAKENVFIALESFKRGVATFIELRTAQQSLAEAYNRLIAARYNAKISETELLRLNGDLIK